MICWQNTTLMEIHAWSADKRPQWGNYTHDLLTRDSSEGIIEHDLLTRYHGEGITEHDLLTRDHGDGMTEHDLLTRDHGDGMTEHDLLTRYHGDGITEHDLLTRDHGDGIAEPDLLTRYHGDLRSLLWAEAEESCEEGMEEEYSAFSTSSTPPTCTRSHRSWSLISGLTLQGHTGHGHRYQV